MSHAWDYDRQNAYKKSMIARGGWTISPKEVIRQYPKKLSFAEQLVIINLHDFIKENDVFTVCRPCQKTLAEIMHTTQGYVSKIIASLCRKNILVKQRNRLASWYEFTDEWMRFAEQVRVLDIPPGISSYSSRNISPILHTEVNGFRSDRSPQEKSGIVSEGPPDPRGQGETGEGTSTKNEDQDRHVAPGKPPISRAPLTAVPDARGRKKVQAQGGSRQMPLLVQVVGGEEESMGDGIGFSKRKQVGARKEKSKGRIEKVSKKVQDGSQSLFLAFCEAMRDEGYQHPASLIPNSHIASRIKEHGVNNAAEAIAFGVKNWGRMNEFFPGGTFAPEPSMRELCLPWVMEGLVARMRHPEKCPAQAPSARKAEQVEGGKRVIGEIEARLLKNRQAILDRIGGKKNGVGS